jgi:CO/xanthine dehydrogenase Mo-binding subunit
VKYKNIGRAINRVDGPYKVSGQSRYSADHILAGTVWGKCLRSPLPHAKILSIDVSKAKSLPGILAILTAKDIPSVLTGRKLRDMPMLAQDRVRFIGEKVAVAASENPAVAEEALSLIDVQYEELPAVFDPVEAMREGSPILHDQLKTYANLPLLDSDVQNVHSFLKWDLGDVQRGFQAADRIFEHTFRTQRVHQGYLEPYSSVVVIDPSGRVQVWTTNKATYLLREFMAGAIGLSENDIVIKQVAIGGDFGGKGALMDTPLCYFLTRLLKQPVKMVMTYFEELMAGNPRHPSIVTVRTGVRKDGRICAREAKIVFNGGAYGAFKPTPPVNLPGSMAAVGPYAIQNLSIRSYCVYTNCVPCGHMRAPGEAQVTFAQESSIDMIAHELGIPAHEFRKINLMKDGDCLPDGTQLIHVQARKTLEAAVSASNFAKPKPKPHVGRGMSMSYRVVGLGPATVRLALEDSGMITLVTTISDQGTGAHTMLLQVVAEAFGVSMKRVRVTVGNTDTLPNDTAPGASRVTHVTGTAAYRAAMALQQRMRKIAAKKFSCDETRVVLKPGFVCGPSKKRLSFAQLAIWARKKVESLEVTQTYDPAPGEKEMVYFSAQVAEVLVDPETGYVGVIRIISTHDIGTVINPITHQGQIEGGLLQGLGFALMEDLTDQEGHIVASNLGEYKIPNMKDMPKLKTVLIKHSTGRAPFGAKAIGENSIDLVAPAIANAIYDAVGVRIADLPISAEKIHTALQGVMSNGAIRPLSL